jgi:protein TonB
MTKILYTLLILLLCTASFAQQPDLTDLTEIDKPAPPKVVEEAPPSPIVFTRVEQMPEFPGGMAGMQQYFRDNLKYPEQALTKGIGGKVVIRFTVDKDGSVIDVIIKRGIGDGCDEEALRLVKEMPSWKPGMHNGRPVKVYYTMPLDFNPGL